MGRVCIFCLRDESRAEACTYGMAHEYPAEAKPKQAPRVDVALCAKCGLHRRNPASATSACAHEYPAGAR